MHEADASISGLITRPPALEHYHQGNESYSSRSFTLLLLKNAFYFFSQFSLLRKKGKHYTIYCYRHTSQVAQQTWKVKTKQHFKSRVGE